MSTRSSRDAHAESLSNLVPGAGAGSEKGELARRYTHGAYAQIAKSELEAKTRELFDAISHDAPVRASDGSLPAHDAIAVRMLAEILIRRERALAEEVANGLEITSGPNKGSLRGVVQYGLQLDRQAMDLLDRLGMTPAARAKLGLTLAQTHRTLEDEIREAGDAWGDAIDSTASDDDAGSEDAATDV